MIIIPGNAQHIGRRNEQQDAFGFSDVEDKLFVSHGGCLAVVADGMGGLKHGSEASQLTLQAFIRSYMSKLSDEKIHASLLKALFKANHAVSQLSVKKNEQGRVGTTLVAAVVHQQLLYWVSVGDSRLYIYRNNHLMLLTQDHTYANELALEVAAGRMSNKEASQDPNKHALTSYVGMGELTLIDCNDSGFKLEVGDRLLLCSDGLYGSLDSQHIISCMRPDPQISADKLVAMVVACRDLNQDNVTVAILDCQDEPEKPVAVGWKQKLKWMLLILLLSLSLVVGYWLLQGDFGKKPQSSVPSEVSQAQVIANP